MLSKENDLILKKDIEGSTLTIQEKDVYTEQEISLNKIQSMEGRKKRNYNKKQPRKKRKKQR